MPFCISFLIIFSLIILNIEVLSLFKGISGENIFLLTLIEFLIFSIYLFKNKNSFKVDFSFFEKLKTALIEDKTLLFLTITLIFMLSVSFILSLISPPNEADASSYHALRALFWARDGFISHFEIADVRCHSMPINSELFYTWVLALFKNDTVFGLLQFFSYFVLIVSSYKIMGIYEIEFKKRLWAILIFSSFAGVVSQISSTQTDLCVGALLTLSLYLVLSYKKEFKLSNLYFASLAMALSFGVKSTGVIGSVPLIIWYIFILRREFIKFFILLVLNFVVFSSYNYVLNFINYGNFLGAKSAINEHSIYCTNLIEFLVTGVSNLIKYFLFIFDFSGLMIFYLLTPLYDNFIQFLFNTIHINPLFNSNGELPHLNAALSEQTIGLGVLGFIVLLPYSIKALFNKKLRPLVLVFVAQSVILSFTIIYYPTTIRFFIAFVSLLIPVLALSFKNGAYKKFTALIAAFYLIFTPLFLTQRPFLNIMSQFIKKPDLKTLTDNIRDVRYKFYFISKKHILLKDEINLLEGKKVALFLNESFMAYPVKYLKNTTFLTYNKPHTLNDFDYIVFENNRQNISTLKAPVEFNNCQSAYYNSRFTGLSCYLDENSFNGFALYKKVEYKADKFLKHTGNDEDSTFYILKRM